MVTLVQPSVSLIMRPLIWRHCLSHLVHRWSSALISPQPALSPRPRRGGSAIQHPLQNLWGRAERLLPSFQPRVISSLNLYSLPISTWRRLHRARAWSLPGCCILEGQHQLFWLQSSNGEEALRGEGGDSRGQWGQCHSAVEGGGHLVFGSFYVFNFY